MTDPIICRHIGRSTWQGPASAAPRTEDRMTPDAEAAERLAVFCGTHGSNRVIAMEVPALIRAQAAEIGILHTAGIAEIAARNPSVMEYMRHWEARAEKAEAEIARHPAALVNAHNAGVTAARVAIGVENDSPADYALRTLDTPASQPDNRVCSICDGGPGNDCQCTCGFQKWDTPQPDADEREAMAEIINDALHEYTERQMWEPTGSPEAIADALLAAGWTRKREADALIEAERRGAERMREQAAAYVSQNSLTWRFSTPWAGKTFAKEIRALPLTDDKETPDD